MRVLEREIPILILTVLMVIFGLIIDNTILALMISVILGIIALMNKQLGILLLLVYLPVRPFLITVNPGYKAIGDFIILFLLVRTFYDYRKDIKKLFHFHFFEIALFIFCLIGIIGALITGVQLMSIITQIRAYILLYILFYIVKRMDITELGKQRFIKTTFIVAIIISIQGMVEKISDKTLLMPEEWTNWWLSPTNHMRVYGLLKGPNELALYLSIAFIISLALLNIYKGKKRLCIYLGLSIIGATFLLTYSRGALICLFMFLLVYILINKKIHQFISILIVAALSGIIFFGVNWLADVYYDKYIYVPIEEKEDKTQRKGTTRIKDTFTEEFVEQSSESGRIYYVKKAIEIFKDSPIAGNGFGTFGGAATLGYSSPIYEKYNITTNFYSDNQYILILAETGILGTIVLMLAFIHLLKIAWNSRKGFFFSAILIYLISTVFVGGAVYNILEVDSFTLYFYIILGIAVQYGGSKNKIGKFNKYQSNSDVA